MRRVQGAVSWRGYLAGANKERRKGIARIGAIQGVREATLMVPNFKRELVINATDDNRFNKWPIKIALCGILNIYWGHRHPRIPLSGISWKQREGGQFAGCFWPTRLIAQSFLELKRFLEHSFIELYGYHLGVEMNMYGGRMASVLYREPMVKLAMPLD